MQEYVDPGFDLRRARREIGVSPTWRVFVSPFGVGAAGGPYNRPKNLTALGHAAEAPRERR